MKTLISKTTAMVSVVATGLLMTGTTTAVAGDHEWATAGKILTGVVAADLLFNHLPARETTVVQTVSYGEPAPAAVTVVETRDPYSPRIYPAPVTTTVYYAPPVYRPPAVVVYGPVYRPAPVFYYGPSVYVGYRPFYGQSWGHNDYHGGGHYDNHGGGNHDSGNHGGGGGGGGGSHGGGGGGGHGGH